MVFEGFDLVCERCGARYLKGEIEIYDNVAICKRCGNKGRILIVEGSMSD
jgi:DNA-directed RNA polymerase subunit RPC12/RpoP